MFRSDRRHHETRTACCRLVPPRIGAPRDFFPVRSTRSCAAADHRNHATPPPRSGTLGRASPLRHSLLNPFCRMFLFAPFIARLPRHPRKFGVVGAVPASADSASRGRQVSARCRRREARRCGWCLPVPPPPGGKIEPTPPTSPRIRYDARSRPFQYGPSAPCGASGMKSDVIKLTPFSRACARAACAGSR